MSLAVAETVTPQEWEERVNLAALYRLVAMHGWDDLVYTHISMRVPGEENTFLLNSYGLAFEEITASSLVKVDLDGKAIAPEDGYVNPAGFTIHSAVHMHGRNAHCVIHTHSNDGVAVASQKHGLLPLSQHAMIVHSEVAYHDYEGIALDHDERTRLVDDLGDKRCMILRNHGLLTTGHSCADAFLRLYFLERACTMQVRALSGGAETLIPHQGVPEKVAGQASCGEDGIGDLAWPALMRRLDRADNSYRNLTYPLHRYTHPCATTTASTTNPQ